MINLLPPDIKDQIAFSKRNAQMVKLLATLALSAVFIGGLMALGVAYLNGRNGSAQRQLTATLDAPSSEIEKTVTSINNRLATIKKLAATKHHYSALLRDLGRSLPDGAYINAINLTGEDKPVRLSISTPSYTTATRVRDSLAALKSRIEAVDIDSITSDGDGYLVIVNVAFVPGGAK